MLYGEMSSRYFTMPLLKHSLKPLLYFSIVYCPKHKLFVWMDKKLLSKKKKTKNKEKTPKKEMFKQTSVTTWTPWDNTMPQICEAMLKHCMLFQPSIEVCSCLEEVAGNCHTELLLHFQAFMCTKKKALYMCLFLKHEHVNDDSKHNA